MRIPSLVRAAMVFAIVTACVVVTAKMEAVGLPAASASATAGPKVDTAQLLDDMRILSSAAYAGRSTGSDGSRKAQAYLQQRYTALGLKPYGAGYAQPFSFTLAFESLALPGRVDTTDYPSAVNVIGYLPGTVDPARVLVVSAHYDHLGIHDGILYAGADDNASGVAALLAIAAHFKAHPPRHTIVFAAFDAEELGMRGARAFLDKLPFPKEQLALNLNMDMVSHNDNNEIVAAGASFTPALRPMVEQAAGRSSVRVKLGHDRSVLPAPLVEDWTATSDHAAFHNAGVPFLYFGVEAHPDYHAPGDTFEHVNQPFFLKVARLLVDVAATLDQQLEAVGKQGR